MKPTKDVLLRVGKLSVSYRAKNGNPAQVLRGVDLEIARGEVVGVLGESGCGKTTLGLSLLRLLPPNGKIDGGRIVFRGSDIAKMKERELEKIRGAEISMVFQEPGISLNPVLRVGQQVADAIRAHRKDTRNNAREKAQEMLALAGLADANRISSAFPHQLSGGQRQRVLIALALACQPALLVADEPTASLDSATQAELLRQFRDWKKQLQLSVLWISHSPAVLAQIADRLLVLYAGQIVEAGTLSEVLANPLHPYTRALLELQKGLRPREGSAPSARLPVIPGEPQAPASLPGGCPFTPRCPDRMEMCTLREPEEVRPSAGRTVRCFKYGG